MHEDRHIQWLPLLLEMNEHYCASLLWLLTPTLLPHSVKNQLLAQAPISQFSASMGRRFMLHSSSGTKSPTLLTQHTSRDLWPSPHGTEHCGDTGHMVNTNTVVVSTAGETGLFSELVYLYRKSILCSVFHLAVSDFFCPLGGIGSQHWHYIDITTL